MCKKKKLNKFMFTVYEEYHIEFILNYF